MPKYKQDFPEKVLSVCNVCIALKSVYSLPRWSDSHGQVRRCVEDQSGDKHQRNNINVQAEIVRENRILQRIDDREMQVNHKEREYENDHGLK